MDGPQPTPSGGPGPAPLSESPEAMQQHGSSSSNSSSRRPRSHPPSDLPVLANFSSSKLVLGAGVAIFHVASARVVLCWHSRDEYWFLPKGRRDAGEESGAGAEREGFEESGYRNRLLPLPLQHRQPRPHNPSSHAASPFVTEPVWTQLMPQSATAQYMLFWYIAETLAPSVEAELDAHTQAAATPENPTPYQYPPPYPRDLTFAERRKQEPGGYEPPRHEGTGVDEEEALYQSFLLPVEDAARKVAVLRDGGVQADVIRTGWEAICLRRNMERGG
ncbi:MAG: hypothetical protein M1819_006138 [Sarea resinae]|nr:MAG: hypothetical protein M1819_006138 [Sarea resinae]